MLRTISILVAFLLWTGAGVSRAQSPEVFLGAQGHMMPMKITTFTDGVETGDETSTGGGVGVALEVRLPFGLGVGAGYRRNVGSVSEVNLDWGFGSNEFVGFAEYGWTVAPNAALEPVLGGGGSVGWLSWSDELDVTDGGSIDIDADMVVFRAYGLARVTVVSRLGVTARLGYQDGTVDAEDFDVDTTITDESGRVLTHEADISGFFAELAVAYRLF